MTVYKKHVSEPWFTYISEGKKFVEGRLNKGSFAEFKIGDKVEWFNDKKKVKTKIVDIIHYKTFTDMIKKEGLKNTLPGYKRIDKGVNEVYYKFYSKQDEKKYGVVAIKLMLM